MLELLSDLKKGKRGAIAKAITIVENNPKNKSILGRLYFLQLKTLMLSLLLLDNDPFGKLLRCKTLKIISIMPLIMF